MPTDPVPAKDDFASPRALEIEVQEVNQQLIANTQLLLLDCRRPEEHSFCAIPGSKLIPMHEIAERKPELEPFRDQPIIVYCHHGVRSLRVVRWLRDQGFATAQSMANGIDRWSLEVDPTVPRY